MNYLHVRMFGTPAIYWDDKKMNFPFAKMEAIIYYLLVVGETTREKLATIFWGEMDDVIAKKNLRNTIYLIKKTLSAQLFITPTRTTIALNPVLITSTDVCWLETMAVQEFLEKCQGDFLDGFLCKKSDAFAEWVIVEREQFKEKIKLRLTKNIIELINNKRYSEAKINIKQLIKLDEYNERAYRLLMKIYEREEAFYKVIEIYNELAKKLSAELNLPPSSKTREIYQRVSEKRTCKAISPNSANSGWFFGRERELQFLRTAVAGFGVKRHKRQMILLQGEQGVGKTAIVERLLENLPKESIHSLRTQCYQAEANYAYKAWSSIFLQVMDVAMQEKITFPPLWHRVMSYIFPALETAEFAGEQEAVMVAYEFNPTMVEEIMCGVLGRLAKQRQLMLVFDDIHWLDSQSLAVLHQVLRIHGAKIFCLAICHSEYIGNIEKMLWNFEHDEMLEKFMVERFSFADVAKLSAIKLPAGKNKAELQKKLYEHTGGNALFLMECLHLLAAGQELGSGSLRLHNVLKERIGNLSNTARKILEVASVFFKYASYNELLSIAKIDEFSLLEAIEELEIKKLIMRADSSLKHGLTYTFYNLQIRNFVYQQMSATRQKLLHKWVGLELEGQLCRGLQAKDIYEAILYHYTQADEKIKVLAYTVKLAEKYFCPQYELFPELNEGYPAGYSNFRERRRQTMDYLEKIAKMLRQMVNENYDNNQLAVYQIAYWEMMGRYYIWRGEHVAGIKMIHKLLRLASARQLQEYLIKGYQQMIFLGIQVSKASIIKKFAEKLLQIAGQADLQEKKAAALRFLGIAAALAGKPGQAEQYYRQSIELFKKIDVQKNCYILNIAASYNYIGNLRRDAEKLQEALSYYEQAVKIASHKKISEGVAVFYINAGYTAFRSGDKEKARQYLGEALAVGDGFGDYRGYWCSRSYCTLYCLLSIIAIQEERYHEGRMYLSKADEFLDRYHDHYQNGMILQTKTKIKKIMNYNQVVADIFADYLTLPVLAYAEEARTAFAKAGKERDMQALAAMM